MPNSNTTLISIFKQKLCTDMRGLGQSRIIREEAANFQQVVLIDPNLKK